MSALFQIEDDAPTRRMLYISALLLVVVPFFQGFTQIWPLQLSNIQWRFQVANFLSSIFLLPFVGLVMLLWLARMGGSRKVSMTVSVISALMSVGLLVSLVLFVLDALQIKAIISSAQLDQWKSQVVRVLGTSSLFVVAFAMLAFASLKTPRGWATASRKTATKQAEEGGDLIVGRV
jgi:hypothetical protein